MPWSPFPLAISKMYFPTQMSPATGMHLVKKRAYSWTQLLVRSLKSIIFALLSTSFGSGSWNTQPPWHAYLNVISLRMQLRGAISVKLPRPSSTPKYAMHFYSFPFASFIFPFTSPSTAFFCPLASPAASWAFSFAFPVNSEALALASSDPTPTAAFAFCDTFSEIICQFDRLRLWYEVLQWSGIYCRMAI